MQSGYLLTPQNQDSGVTEFFKMGTTVRGRSYVNELWSFLGFKDNTISPYMDKFEGSERYDISVRDAIEKVRHLEEANQRYAAMGMYDRIIWHKQPGYALTHADGRLLLN